MILCLAGLATFAGAEGLSPDAARAARAKAIAADDYATALAWDDALIAQKSDEAMRAERKEHFRKAFDVTISTLGPATVGNVEEIIGNLLALREFATHIAGERRTDLEPIAEERMAAKLGEITPQMWERVDAIAARGEVSRAIALAYMIPNGDPARIAKLGEGMASNHLALAKEATEDLVGARILHARLARFFGADIGDLASVPPQLQSEIGRNWVIDANSDCGIVAGSIDSTKERLDVVLGRAYPPGPGISSTLRVTFSECPVTKREWNTVEDKGYLAKEKVQVRVEVPTDYSCGNWSSTTDKGASTTTTTSTRYCGPTGTTWHWEEREVENERFARTTIAHRVHHFVAKGTISVELYGITRAEPFVLEADSDDDTATSSDCPTKDCPASVQSRSTPHHNWSEWQARLRVHDALTPKIQSVVSAVVATKVKSYLARASAAVDGNRPLEADHAFAVAHQILGGSVDPTFAAWIQRQYNLSNEVLLAALGSIARPPFKPEGTYTITLPAVNLRDEHAHFVSTYNANQEAEFRRLLWFSLSVGPMFAETTGGSGSQKGGLGSLQVIGLIKHALVGLRFTGGYGASHGQIELDVLGGYGLRAGDFALHAVTGLGMNTSSGNQERVGPTPDHFIIPIAAYWLYGARISYALPIGAKLEALYTKVFRTSVELAAEKRFEARLIVRGIALTMRYAEYLPDVDSFLGTFDADTRFAKSLWTLVGGGF